MARQARLSRVEASELLNSVVVLDVRPAAEFERGHLEGSGNIPESELEDRRHELPPDGTQLLVVADDPNEAESAARALELRFPDVAWLDTPIGEMNSAVVTGPATRLWRPAAFLELVIRDIPRGRALDLACGAGREAVYLALQGFDVEAWDHDPYSLERCRDLARRHGVNARVENRDLEARRVEIPEAAFALITCFRFLHRPLLRKIERALAPGGHLVYETFRVGQERFGRPCRAEFLLKPEELLRAFANLEMLSYEEPSPPGGPLTARLHARKA
jgi:SAM-dependent methyltransferase